MSVLADFEIKEEIKKGRIIVSPYDDPLINPNSLDVRLGTKFGRVRGTQEVYRTKLIGPKFARTGLSNEDIGRSIVNFYPIVDPKDPSTFETLNWETDESVYLDPHESIIACLKEDITLPDDICAKIYGKSSLARLGLDCCSVGAWIDSGFSGIITLELFNQSNDYSIKLTPDMKIGQLVFYKSEPAEKPYGIVGRYQRQNPGQGSLGCS